MPLIRAGATDREELAILTMWTTVAAVTLNTSGVKVDASVLAAAIDAVSDLPMQHP
jgi:hypothetical protein